MAFQGVKGDNSKEIANRRTRKVWTAPVEDVVDISISVYRNSNMSKSGIGMVALACHRKLMSIWATKEDCRMSVEQDLAEAIKLTLIKACEQGWKKIRIFTNNPSIMSQLARKEYNHATLSILREDILWFSSLFSKCTFCVCSIENDR
ncbi:hypothetical protein ACH5RR_013796 [Cinchona calisaya]|uniref:RNase H type-1 domain-containing protein n=1 Tax=Cinchona calisaya TaxID=153742 RepID=A0ABD3A2G4_9GENT